MSIYIAHHHKKITPLMTDHITSLPPQNTAQKFWRRCTKTEGKLCWKWQKLRQTSKTL